MTDKRIRRSRRGANQVIGFGAVSTPAQAADEKISLPMQEAKIRDLCQEMGWELIDMILVPGYSRRYYSLRELADAALKKGIDGPDRLDKHLAAGDFDRLITFSTDRFGRTQALNAEVIERTIIDCGAEIYSLSDGLITDKNVRPMIAITGYRDASHIDFMVQKRREGMAARADNGKSVSSVMPLFHKRLRDEESGKEIGIVVNEDLRQLWNDLATLVLEGIAYGSLETVLFERFGHARPDGKPYARYTMYQLLMNPAMHGHRAQNYSRQSTTRRADMRLWAWDENAPVPPGVRVVRNVVPPLYTGELAERLRAELTRRSTTVKGRTQPDTPYRFTGLFICDECKRRLAVNVHSKKYFYMRCAGGYDKLRGRSCSQREYVPWSYLQEYLTELISRRLEAEGVTSFESEDATTTATISHDLEREISSVEDRIGTLIQEQSFQPAVAQDYYRREIARLSQYVEQLKTRFERAIVAEQRAAASQQGANATLEHIRQVGLPAFWKEDDLTINQYLHQFLGDRVLRVREGKVVGWEIRPTWQPEK